MNSTTFSGTEPDGVYKSTSLPAGEYRVMALVSPTLDQPGVYGMSDVTLSGPDPVTVPLVLQPAFMVSGRVIYEGTELAPPDMTKTRVNLSGPSGSVAQLVRPAGGTVDSAGKFSLSGLVPAKYILRASAPVVSAPGGPGWTVKSVKYGDRDVTDQPIDINSGDNLAFTITFTDRLSELSGLLKTATGQPATDYFVVVLPADRQQWLALSLRIVSARPDATGRYIFRSLPAGDYLIAATTDLVPGDLQDLNALAQIATQGTKLTVGPGEKKTFDLVLR